MANWNNLNRRTVNASTRRFARHSHYRTTFRNPTIPRKQSHHPRQSRVPANPRITVKGPFGEVVKKIGAASEQIFRFSTKYQDDETGLLYYGYRFMNASTGRWVSRDPIGERGGRNLFGYANNEPVDKTDYLGKSPSCACPDSISIESLTPLNGPYPNSGPLIQGQPIHPGLWWGHSFDLKVCLTYYCSQASTPPSLQWFERSSRDFFGVPANTERDSFIMFPTSVQAHQWSNRREPPPPSQICFFIHDIPAMQEDPANAGTKTLDFRLVINGSCTTCNPMSRTVRARQSLELNADGTPSSSSFTITP